MKRALLLLVVIFFLCVAVVIAQYFFLGKEQRSVGQVDKLTVGKEVEYGTLFSLAAAQGYFAQNGLDVTLKEYDSGAPAFADLLQGKVDMIDAADFVGVKNSFAGNNFKILASVGTTTDAWEMIARRDHGIHTPSDLRGKTIGVPAGTLGEFFLGNFLLLNKIEAADVHIVNFPPTELLQQMQDGTLDAVMLFQPYAFSLRERLGEKGIRFDGQSDRPNYIVLYATNAVVKNHPATVRRFLHALIQAQEFLDNNPAVLHDFMQQTYGYNNAYISSVISTFTFRVELDQQMLPLMEDEAQWAIDSNQTSVKIIPNYLDFIYFDGLNNVMPSADTIIQ